MKELVGVGVGIAFVQVSSTNLNNILKQNDMKF